VSAQVTGGLSTNSVNKANVTSHIVGKRSNSTSGGLSTNSVNKANVTSHIVGMVSPLSVEVLTMVYTKGSIHGRIVEFDISTKNYKSVTALERTDKYYFIIMTPKNSSILDSAIAKLESNKT